MTPCIIYRSARMAQAWFIRLCSTRTGMPVETFKERKHFSIFTLQLMCLYINVVFLAMPSIIKIATRMFPDGWRSRFYFVRSSFHAVRLTKAERRSACSVFPLFPPFRRDFHPSISAIPSPRVILKRDTVLNIRYREIRQVHMDRNEKCEIAYWAADVFLWNT